MKRAGDISFAFASLFVLAGSIQADGPVPFFLRRDHRPHLEFRAPPAVPARIETSPEGPQLRLIIPRKLLDNVRPPWFSVQPPGDNPVSWAKKFFPLGAGLGLGLLLLPIGLGKVQGRRLAVAIGLLLAVCATFFLVQNSRAHQPRPPQMPFKLTGWVTVHVVEEGDAIRMIFNKDQAITAQWGS
jgi:hypothetical protein